MANKLLGDWRLRVSNANSLNFSAVTRLHFFDALLMTDKAVYADINSDVSLGAYVELDNGYVPVSGVWLTTGAYSCRVETYSYTTDLGVDVYTPLWTIPYIPGAEEDVDGSILTVFDTVEDLRAFEPDGTNAMCLGYYTIGDMLTGGAVFNWESTSTSSDDEGSIIKPTSYSTSDEGRWVRLFEVSPTIRDFGAVPDQDNVKVRILNAQVYAAGNNLTLLYPPGTYTLATEDLIIDSGVVYDDCFFDTTGIVTYDGCTINLTKAGADNVAILNIPMINPAWYGAAGDGVTNDMAVFELMYADALISGATVELGEAYYIYGAGTFNTGGIVNTAFKPESTLAIDTLASEISLGIITTPGWDGDGCISIDDASYVVPFGTIYQRWFYGFTALNYSLLLNSASYEVTFIWDSNFIFNFAYTEVAKVTHVFTNDAQWQVTASSTFSITQFDYRNLVDTASLVYLSGVITIINTSTTNISLDADLVFTSTITFDSCIFDVSGIRTITMDYGVLDDCKFINGTSVELISTTGVTVTNCLCLMPMYLNGVNIDITHCRVNDLYLFGTSVRASYNAVDYMFLIGDTSAALTGKFVTNNTIQYTIELISSTTDTIITDITITDNIFVNERSYLRITKSGSFSNVANVHKFVIKDNTAPSYAEQTYVPMTEGEVLWRANESGVSVLATPSVTLFDYTLALQDDVYYNGYTIMERQVFTLNGSSDVNKFNTLEMINCVGKHYSDTTDLVDEQNDIYFQIKELIVGDLFTNATFNVNRLPINDGTILSSNWLSGVIRFSLYKPTLYDNQLVRILP